MIASALKRRRRCPAPGWLDLALVAWRQWRAEHRLAAQGIRFRLTDPRTLRTAYVRMGEEHFAWINGRQDWANWRTIPRHLECLDQPGRWQVIDLGCGAGGSTRVLAWCSPPGSHILGYDFAVPLLDAARCRDYVHATGAAANVAFRYQSLVGTWCDEAGLRLPSKSVTLVNASGVLGHHVDSHALEAIAAEIARVLAPRGVALLDVGPATSARRLSEVMQRHGLAAGRRVRSCWLDPYGQIAFLRANEAVRRKPAFTGRLGSRQDQAATPSPDS